MSTRSATHPPAAILAVLGALALVVRVGPGALAGSLANRFEYDGGVMFGATLRALAASTPYADFTFVHPPGSIVLYTPAAALAEVAGEHSAFAVLVAITAIVGAANVVLIGILLGPYGTGPVIIGAGMYAVWPIVVVTERQVMLEPILNLCVLGALLAVRRGGRDGIARLGGAWIAGALIGIALTVKYWAVVDVVLIATVVIARTGVKGLWRYLAAGTMTAGAIALPFFLRAPQAMWEQTVIAQLTRPETGIGLAERINMLSPFWAAPWLDAIFPWWVWAALVSGALVLAAMPIVTAVRGRLSPRTWSDPAWWGIVALAHTAVIALSSSFYDHYAAWALAPLALTTGFAASLLSLPRVVAGAGIGVAVALTATQLTVPPATELTPMREWARSHTCVWGTSTALIASDAFRRSIAADCATIVDVFGTRLTLMNASAGDADSADAELDALLYAELDRADGAIVGRGDWWVVGGTAERLQSQFGRVTPLGGIELWQRVRPAGAIPAEG